MNVIECDCGWEFDVREDAREATCPHCGALFRVFDICSLLMEDEEESNGSD